MFFNNCGWGKYFPSSYFVRYVLTEIRTFYPLLSRNVVIEYKMQTIQKPNKSVKTFTNVLKQNKFAGCAIARNVIAVIHSRFIDKKSRGIPRLFFSFHSNPSKYFQLSGDLTNL